MIESLTSATSEVVRTALDGLALRQRVVANNIANANSAGFVPQTVDFETALRAAADDGAMLDGSASTRVRGVAQSIAAGEYIRGADRDGVQLDVEMMELNRTVIKYQALIQGLMQSGSMVRMAIGEGK